jgi:hypothetical protein
MEVVHHHHHRVSAIPSSWCMASVIDMDDLCPSVKALQAADAQTNLSNDSSKYQAISDRSS